MATTGMTNGAAADAWADWALSAGYLSNEISFPKRLILFWLKAARARLIKEKLKREELSKFNYQTIPCIQLESVDQSECPCAPKSGCTFLRTVEPIPKALAIISVTSLLGNISYNYVGWDKMRYKTVGRFAAAQNKPYYTIKDVGDGAHLYLYNSKHQKKISVTAIFEDPLDVQCFPDENGNVNCCDDPWEQEFLIDADLVSTMFDLAMGSMMRFKAQNTDAFHNDQDDTTNHRTNIK